MFQTVYQGRGSSMEFGLYEKILDSEVNNQISLLHKEKRKVDSSESARVLATAYYKILRKILSEKKDKEKIEFVKKLNKEIGNEILCEDDKNFIELLAVHDDEDVLKKLISDRPKTSISSSTLFTGYTGPTLESELRREIRTADRIDFIVSFIKYSGLVLILDDLVEFTKTKKLRIITTSYMGASDYKAILKLSQLPNTEVKISYDTNRTRLHAKAYYFERNTGFSTAYIGSSNISNPALSKGLEWNLKVSEYTSKDVVDCIIKTFETYWKDDEFRAFMPGDEEDRKELKIALSRKEKNEDKKYLFFDLRPFSHQKEILEDLRLEREEYGSHKNLVVAATGTGKTMVAAFDYKNIIKNRDKKLLFLAHRKEILQQSIGTFRNVLKDQNFGELWVDNEAPKDFNYIFASVQTLNSNGNYFRFPKDYFDYIVIDESHHSAASSYLKILEYFEPEILLGLTATPERMDGANILEYFNNRIASEIRLGDAIDRKLLSPFNYFGVSDPVNLSHLKWKRGGYETSELENVYTKSKQRVQVIIDALEKYLADLKTFKALGFCVSIAHANFMAKSFNKVGIKAVALHSDSISEERRLAKAKLQKGEINCIFTVDLFNEGVDIPDIDTVLFLRPTESLTVFIQQLGRGLRLSEGKDALTVLDFIGQAHKNYDFSFKLRALIGKTSRGIKEEILDEFPNMPAGCHIRLEKIAQRYILNNIQSSIINKSKIKSMIANYHNVFSSELNVRNFLDNYGINKEQFYSKYKFYELVAETNLSDSYKVTHSRELNNSLRRFSSIDSKRLLIFSKRLLTEDLSFHDLDKKEKIMLGIFYYTLWGNVPEVSYMESLRILKEENQDIVKELLEIIDYNLSKLRVIEIPYEDKEIPLDIYASYTTDQIMVAFGKTTEDKQYSSREGVLYIKEKNTDLFFITINKNKSDYLPSTMYNDYAISSDLFNWESQNKTSVETPTGKRYINDRTEEHKVLLFVRENKKKHGNASPYIFLGNARYVSHKGSKPIQIIWKMDHPIPERIIRESKLKVVN